MSCILRLIGTNLDVDSIQSKITIAIDNSWKKGEPRFSQKENSKLHEKSGVTYLVSNAEFEEFEIQKIDAIAFMRQYFCELKKIHLLDGLEFAFLDFGITRRDVVVQCDYFQSELLLLAGQLGFDIELSQYPVSQD